MGDEQQAVKEKLLKNESVSAQNSEMNVATIQNEKGKREDKEEGDLRLHDAVYDPDNIEEIEKLVSEEPKLVSERDNEGRTPLITLAFAGDEQAEEIAKILVGANESDDDSSLISIDRPDVLNLQDIQNATALHYAARGRQTELVSALIKWGANADIQDINGNTPMHLAAEGNTEKAIQVVKILLEYKTKKSQSLIQSTNNNELTPLHVAIGKKAVKMVNFLLQKENKCNLSIKNSINRTVIHYACSATDESDSSCEIVKSLLKSCSKEQLNKADYQGRTALHLATIKRFPKIVKILVDDERMDVVKTDEIAGRTALHYATENGCYTKGYQCVEALIRRKFEKYGDQVNYLYKMEDSMKNTPAMYACVNCPAETMKKYTALCPKPQYWLSSLYMTLIYKNCPLALSPLMDNAFTETESDAQEGEDGIQTDFGIISGYIDPIDKMPQQETKYLKQALWWNYDAQKEIVLHPLVQLFVMKKWQNLKFIVAVWILWQILWQISYTFVGLSFYRGAGNGPDAFVVIAAVLMSIYIVGSLVNEAFEMFTVGTSYFLSLTNLVQLLQCALGLIAVHPVFLRHDSPQYWTKYTTAFGILLAWILGMRDVGKLHSEIGLIVEVLKQVLIQIVQVLVSCLSLLIGFTAAFTIIFDDEESLKSTFPGPMIKVLVWMSGEFEYNDTFKNEEGEKIPENDWARFVRLLFFLAFLISVTFGFFNLLQGIALEKVLELREKAKVARVLKQLEHIYFIESILLTFRPLRKLFPHSSVVSFLRRLNVTSKWFNTETGPQLKFETFIAETLRKSERSFKRNNSGFQNKLCHGPLKFCQSGLEPEILEKIYALASPSQSSS